MGTIESGMDFSHIQPFWKGRNLNLAHLVTFDILTHRQKQHPSEISIGNCGQEPAHAYGGAVVTLVCAIASRVLEYDSTSIPDQ